MEQQEAYSRIFSYLGGRKMTLIFLSVAVGTAIDILTERGLSVNMAGLLAGLVAAFNAADVMITNKVVDAAPIAPPPPPEIHNGNIADHIAGNDVVSSIVQKVSEQEENLFATASTVETLKGAVEAISKKLNVLLKVSK